MEKITLKSRIAKPTLKELHNMGWTKNHLRLDVLCVGKWRCMGYFQGEKAFKRVFAEATNRIAINSGMSKDRFVILEPSRTDIIDESIDKPYFVFNKENGHQVDEYHVQACDPVPTAWEMHDHLRAAFPLVIVDADGKLVSMM